MCSISGMPNRSANIEISSEVCGVVDSPTSKRGWTSSSMMTTLTPCLANTVASIDPERPPPKIATSKVRVDPLLVILLSPPPLRLPTFTSLLPQHVSAAPAPRPRRILHRLSPALRGLRHGCDPHQWHPRSRAPCQFPASGRGAVGPL